MNAERNMCDVQNRIRCEREAESSKKRVHMPEVRAQNADKPGRIAKIIAVLLALITINFSSVIALMQLAYWERGYVAVGGEWLLIILIAVVSCRWALKTMKNI